MIRFPDNEYIYYLNNDFVERIQGYFLNESSFVVYNGDTRLSHLKEVGVILIDWNSKAHYWWDSDPLTIEK